MRNLIYIAITVFLVISLSSCGAGVSAKRATQNEVAGYTLKNKKEIMEQKILHKKSKTIIVLP